MEIVEVYEYLNSLIKHVELELDEKFDESTVREYVVYLSNIALSDSEFKNYEGLKGTLERFEKLLSSPDVQKYKEIETLITERIYNLQSTLYIKTGH